MEFSSRSPICPKLIDYVRKTDSRYLIIKKDGISLRKLLDSNPNPFTLQAVH